MSILECKNITKTFTGTVALDKVGFKVEKAQIHALVGENGAGKSTLSSIISGLQKQTSGEIFVDDKLVQIKNAADAKRLGITIMTQEVDYCPHLTVAGNIFLGQEVRKNSLLDWKYMNSETQKVLDRLGVDFKATDKAVDLSISQKQQMQLARIMHSKAKLIIMDEPTSTLSEQEVETLFNILRTMRSEDLSIIYISHRMEEIFEIADTVTVLRDGKIVGSKPIAETSIEDIVSMIIGKKQKFTRFERSSPLQEKAILEVKNYEREGQFSDINFRLNEGEVLGLFGLRGSGNAALIRALFGSKKTDKGEIIIDQQKKEKTIRSSIENKVVFIPSNRREEGIIKTMSVKDNIVAGSLEKFSNLGVINHGNVAKTSTEMVEKLGVSCHSINQQISKLSGGNQQKVLFARSMEMDAKILLINNPTRGIDVGAKVEIYKVIRELSEKGLSVIVASSELSDIISVCDRVLVMHKGRIKKEYKGSDINEENLLQTALK